MVKVGYLNIKVVFTNVQVKVKGLLSFKYYIKLFHKKIVTPICGSNGFNQNSLMIFANIG